MIRITLTSEKVGTTELYEFVGRRGRRKKVPIYRAVAVCQQTGRRFVFAVTRQSSQLVFAKNTKRFGTGGECPPSRAHTPYHGRVRTDGKVGFAIQLYEPCCARQVSVRGRHAQERRHILIHRGPGSSHGCLMIAGGRRGHQRFVRALQALCGPCGCDIRVVVRHRVEAR